MKIDYKAQPPAVHIHYAPPYQAAYFNQLLYGMEEEGMPYVLSEKEGKTTAELGYEAALESTLGVGIGIGIDQTICLHYHKLQPREPLFSLPATAKAYQLRALGANAARLIKRMPFIPLAEEKISQLKTPVSEGIQQEPKIDQGTQPQEELSQAEISWIVEQVIKRMKNS